MAGVGMVMSADEPDVVLVRLWARGPVGIPDTKAFRWFLRSPVIGIERYHTNPSAYAWISFSERLYCFSFLLAFPLP